MNGDIDNTLIVSVREGERRAETVVVDGPRVLVGAGAHCDVCLPPGSAAPEQLELLVGPSGELSVRALADAPPALLRGSPFRSERLAPGEPILVGSTAIEVSLADRGKEDKRSRGVAPVRAAAMVVAAAIAVALSFVRHGEGASARTPQPPSLWPREPARCASAEVPTALGMATDLRARAEAKRERVRFAVHDGVEAVWMLERASACFAVAREPAKAAEAIETATKLKARLDEEYRGHQLRLEHAMAVEEIDTALHETRVLRALVPPGNGYAAWLASLERGLVQRQRKKVGA